MDGRLLTPSTPDAFSHLHLHGVTYGVLHLRPPWSFKVNVREFGGLFFVMSGSCWFEEERGSAHCIREHNMVATPAALAHEWRSHKTLKAPAVQRSMPRMISLRDWRADDVRHQDTVLLIASNADAREASAHLRPPPTMLIGPEHQPSYDRIRFVLQWVEQEYSRTEPDVGAGSVIRRLSEIMVAELLRVATRQRLLAGSSTWLPPGDRYVSQALACIFADPDGAWTVESLAKAVGLSRSSLADRFRAAVGASPMSYLTELRISRAAEAIKEGELPTAEIAKRAGYNSEASFYRAFSRVMGLTPGEFRSAKDGSAKRPR